MNVTRLFSVAALAAIALAIGSVAIADPKDEKSDKPAAPPLEFKLPPGWTQADVEACMLAGIPGKMHEALAAEAGEWSGKATHWMGPDSDPIVSECTFVITPMLDGRFTKTEMKGEMPGMGPYHGFGVQGFDNVSQQFVGTWIDSYSTGIANGIGKRSDDGKTLTWNYTFNCPITKKPAVLRQVETTSGNTKHIEMFGPDPKTGKEHKMMRFELTKKQ